MDCKPLVIRGGKFTEIPSTDRLASPDLLVNGSITVKRTPVNANYPIAIDDYYLGVDTTAPRTLTLPTAVGVTGQEYVVKDETGGAGSNNITIQCSGAETIDGQATQKIIVAYGVIGVISNGTNWSVMPVHTQDWLTPTQHKGLYDLIHFIDDGPADGFVSGAYHETLPTGDPFPTSFTWYDSSGVGKKKIVQKTLVRNANKTPATITWRMYDSAETLLVTVTDAISYSAVFETTRTRTWV